MRIILWIALAAAVVIGILWQFYPLENAKKRAEELPLHGAAFTGEDIPLNDFEKDFFGEAAVVKRLYRVGKNNYFITVIDGTTNRHVVHDPYYCFTGSGWTIDHETVLNLEGGQITQLEISKGDERSHVIFWFSDSGHPYNSPWRYWWEATLRRLTLGKSGPEPVLTFVMLLDNQKPNWQQFAELFPQLFHL